MSIACLPTFEDYIGDFSLSFPASELAQRKTLYDERLAVIAEHNSRAGQLWTAGVNLLTASTESEFLAMLGYNKAYRDEQADLLLLAAASTRPSRWDWREATPSVVTPVKSQGACGSCWAFAATEVLETAIAIGAGTLYSLSPQQLTWCTPNPQSCGGNGGCSGATAQLAFNYTMASGIAAELDWPFDFTSGDCFGVNETANYASRVAGITGYVSLPRNDASALLAAVLQNPVAVTVAASNWGLYNGGISNECKKSNPILNHAVTLMGYGELSLGVNGTVHYWLIRNSWGPLWGEQGYIRLQRYPEEEPCGVDTEPLRGYSCAKNAPTNVTACGECGILSDSSYPTGAFLGFPKQPEDPALRPTSFYP